MSGAIIQGSRRAAVEWRSGRGGLSSGLLRLLGGAALAEASTTFHLG